jgi:DNA repair protein RecO (recombination protein O)
VGSPLFPNPVAAAMFAPMQWSDEGVVVGVKRHGESSLLVELMTRDHGRHLGIVRGGAGPRLRPVLQAGNTVAATWRARLDEHLGNYAIELLTTRAAHLMASGAALNGLALASAHCRLLPERDPHAAVFEALTVLVDHLGEPALAGPLMVRFELALLEELGFGLDLTECVATGSRDALTHVSPKSGRAVCWSAAEPWLDRLLVLPPFLGTARAGVPDVTEIAAGFRLTGHFLERDVWGPRGVGAPDCRSAFVAACARAVDEPRAALPAS